MSKKTYLFVDGSNLYGSQFNLFGPNKILAFDKFIDRIEKYLKLIFDKIYFYASYSPNPEKTTKKQKLYLKNEGLFYNNVRQIKKVEFFKGYRSPTSGKEKEVDVKLAVDMIDMAHKNKFDQMFLISGDADFLHALFAVDKLKKRAQLICLEDKVMFKASFYFKTIVLFQNKHSKSQNNLLSKHLSKKMVFKFPLKDIK